MPMKHFTILQLREAEAYANQSPLGGQPANLALHTHNIIVNRTKAPSCFIREVDAGRDIAHLFCQDEAYLIATARRLGVKVILVERRGERGQHIDLCGGPLKKALAECRREALDNEEDMALFAKEGHL